MEERSSQFTYVTSALMELISDSLSNIFISYLSNAFIRKKNYNLAVITNNHPTYIYK